MADEVDIATQIIYDCLSAHISRYKAEDFGVDHVSVELKAGPGKFPDKRIWLNIDGVPYIVSARVWSSS